MAELLGIRPHYSKGLGSLDGHITVPVAIARFTTFAQFRDHLISLGCLYGDLSGVTTRHLLVYFENPIPGRAIPPNAVMKKLADGDELLPSQIRSVCDQLEIDPAEFGFNYP